MYIHAHAICALRTIAIEKDNFIVDIVEQLKYHRQRLGRKLERLIPVLPGFNAGNGHVDIL
jgi:hypothetical protein